MCLDIVTSVSGSINTILCVSLIDVDSEREGGGTDSGISSVGETVKEQISEEGKGFNVPEIEFQEYKVNLHM